MPRECGASLLLAAVDTRDEGAAAAAAAAPVAVAAAVAAPGRPPATDDAVEDGLELVCELGLLPRVAVPAGAATALLDAVKVGNLVLGAADDDDDDDNDIDDDDDDDIDDDDDGAVLPEVSVVPAEGVVLFTLFVGLLRLAAIFDRVVALVVVAAAAAAAVVVVVVVVVG